MRFAGLEGNKKQNKKKDRDFFILQKLPNSSDSVSCCKADPPTRGRFATKGSDAGGDFKMEKCLRLNCEAR